GDTKTFEISLVGRNSLSAEKQEAITTALTEKFADNKIELYNSNSVSPTIAGTFFAKSIVAVLITAVLVVIYVGIRFRKIGGVSAAITALCALILDMLITFFTCVLFRLQIDSNYIAVVLTILGYSLNDTIVVYDRIRENERFEPDAEIGDLVNKSINAVKTRNFITTLTTFLAVMTIVVVSELFGLTSLRTFAIPMAFGLVSGCISSLFIAGPLWVVWKRHRAKKAAKK
ncbi:MAG: protein translocase subunit SecF, partial [Clostridia bacterium]|nr:protein translocase subunit SecF [Clostridia bacterium]